MAKTPTAADAATPITEPDAIAVEAAQLAADAATPITEPDAIAVEAAQLAQDAAARSPEYPGYEAVRDLYDEYLRLSRRHNDLAGLVESLKSELADLRREVNNG